jgi:hypothetical protein
VSGPRAVALCLPGLTAKQADCLQGVVRMGWEAVAGRPPAADERVELHHRIERLAERNSPHRGGRLEIYHAANAATFVLGSIANPDNLKWAPSLLSLVPNVLRALHPNGGYESAEEKELNWQEVVLAGLPGGPDLPSSAWFADQ